MRPAHVLLTLGVGAAGGALFAWLQVPLGWVIGAMVATTVAALAGAPIAVPRHVRTVMITVLGIMLGSAFSPEILSRAVEWIAVLGLLALFVPMATATTYVYFRRIAGFDPTTAYFAAAPGGFNEMTIAGDAMGGDARRIALVHATRIFIVVMTIPFYVRYVEHAQTGPAAIAATIGDLALRDAALLAACAAIGWPLGRLLRLPAAPLVGPMLLSAIAHLAGLTHSRPPTELVAIAQIVVGSAVGSRFAGLALSQVARMLAIAAGSAVILLAFTVIFVTLFGGMAGTSRSALLLALAPGGLAEMSLVALALGIDTAFVATMHVLRIVLVVVLAPLAFMGFRRLGARKAG